MNEAFNGQYILLTTHNRGTGKVVMMVVVVVVVVVVVEEVEEEVELSSCGAGQPLIHASCTSTIP